MLLTVKGKIVRTPVAQISVLKRATQGVTLISIKDDSLVAVQRIAEKDVEEDKASEVAEVTESGDKPVAEVAEGSTPEGEEPTKA